jgi:hypothetical protein
MHVYDSQSKRRFEHSKISPAALSLHLPVRAVARRVASATPCLLQAIPPPTPPPAEELKDERVCLCVCVREIERYMRLVLW